MMMPSFSNGILGVGAIALFALGLAGGWLSKPGENPDLSHLQRHTAEAAKPPGTPGRLIGTAGFDEAFEPKDFASRVYLAVTMQDATQRARALHEAARQLDSAAIQEAIKATERNDSPHREEVVAQLFARWGEIEPTVAMVAAQKESTLPAQVAAVNAVLGAWLDKDPTAAERWALELPDGILKNSALDTLISGIAVSDPKHALQLASDRDLSWEGARTTAHDIFDAWIGVDPQEAAAQALQLGPGELRTAALRTVAEEWARVDLREALAWADSLPDTDYTVKPLNSFGLSPIYGVLSQWIEGDSAAAVNWLAHLPEGQRRTALVASACTFLRSATANPAVMTQLVKLLPDASHRNETLQSFAQQMASWEPSSALAWVREQRDPEARGAMLSGLLSHLAGDPLLAALEYAKSATPDERENLITIQSRNNGGTSMWNLADPATLAAWAERQPNNQEYLNRIAASWTQKDPVRAAEWLQRLPAVARDTALRGIIQEATDMVPIDTTFATAQHFQEAERWILQLSDPKARESSYEKLAERWIECDPESARAWISASPLPERVKNRLSK